MIPTNITMPVPKPVIRSFNKLLACLAQENKGVERKVVNGVAQILHRSSLTSFTVAFDSDQIPEGATVWVKSSMVMNTKWATEVHEVEGKQVVFMPQEFVVLVKAIEPSELAVRIRNV